MKVLGVQHYSFDKDGQHIEGNKLHCLLEIPEITMEGREVRLISVNDNVLNECLQGMPVDKFIGREIEVIYNRYGKPAHLRIVK